MEGNLDLDEKYLELTTRINDICTDFFYEEGLDSEDILSALDRVKWNWMIKIVEEDVGILERSIFNRLERIERALKKAGILKEKNLE